MTRKTKAEARWAALIASQESSGKRVRTFCREQAVSEHSFYMWRKRLRSARRVEFARLEATPTASPASLWTLELTLTGGDVLRIAHDADPVTLRHVLDTLRE